MRSRTYGAWANQNQGGGEKKAGFPYMVGRDSWTSIAFRQDMVMNLTALRQLPAGYPKSGIVNMNFPFNFRNSSNMRMR